MPEDDLTERMALKFPVGSEARFAENFMVVSLPAFSVNWYVESKTFQPASDAGVFIYLESGTVPLDATPASGAIFLIVIVSFADPRFFIFNTFDMFENSF